MKFSTNATSSALLVVIAAFYCSTSWTNNQLFVMSHTSNAVPSSHNLNAGPLPFNNHNHNHNKKKQKHTSLRHLQNNNNKCKEDCSDAPSSFPSVTSMPSFHPSIAPSIYIAPSIAPSMRQSSVPSNLPSVSSSNSPSLRWSMQPTVMPSDGPSRIPSNMPSGRPSWRPSDVPSLFPSLVPSVPVEKPSAEPTISVFPSSRPTIVMSVEPSTSQTVAPSALVVAGDPTHLPTRAPVSLEFNIPLPEIILNVTYADTENESDESSRGFLVDINDLFVRTRTFLSDFIQARCALDYQQCRFENPISLIIRSGETGDISRQRRQLYKQSRSLTSVSYVRVTYSGYATFSGMPHPHRSEVESWVSECFTEKDSIEDFVVFLRASGDPALASTQSVSAQIGEENTSNDSSSNDDNSGGEPSNLFTIVGIAAGSATAAFVIGILLLRRKVNKQRRTNMKNNFVELFPDEIEVQEQQIKDPTSPITNDLFNISQQSMSVMDSLHSSSRVGENTSNDNLSYTYSLNEFGELKSRNSRSSPILGIASKSVNTIGPLTPNSTNMFERVWDVGENDESVVSFDHASIPFDECIDKQDVYRNTNNNLVEDKQDDLVPLAIIHSVDATEAKSRDNESVSDVSDRSADDLPEHSEPQADMDIIRDEQKLFGIEYDIDEKLADIPQFLVDQSQDLIHFEEQPDQLSIYK